MMINLILGKYELAISYYRQQMHEDCFEFHFTYVPRDERFRELDRFIWESRHTKTRFKNKYAGPVLIDITEWNFEIPNDYFTAFMFYLKDNPDLECTFLAENEISSILLQKLSAFFEVNVIKLETRETVHTNIGFYIEEANVDVRS